MDERKVDEGNGAGTKPMIENVVSLPKPGQVLHVCPNCGKKQRSDGEEGQIITVYMVMAGPDKLLPALPKILCLSCGIESFSKKDLLMLREKAKASKQMIVTPPQTSLIVPK